MASLGFSGGSWIRVEHRGASSGEPRDSPGSRPADRLGNHEDEQDLRAFSELRDVLRLTNTDLPRADERSEQQHLQKIETPCLSTSSNGSPALSKDPSSACPK